jgi:hypothetical protein
MTDLLRIEFINTLPQPLWVRQWGRQSFDWPLHEICVETGLMQIDVCGKLDNLHIGDVAQFKDDAGNIYDSEMFYTDYEDDIK